ncbi:Mitochondrial intermembrane space cysteine motif-containing protein MIX23 [Paramyrothecium foliicola]|nr:Mitochondrial intermembrane space cysteine motif-containing protein MIX23 [Paramyrothecium foliicola]
MAHPSSQPKLTPQFCFSSVTLRDFLRLSRSTIDDSIVQNLNALATPARSGFDPASTAQRSVQSPPRAIDSHACQTFKDGVLFPSWQARTEVIKYCSLVAASPDPDDPDATLREIETQKERERVVDERLDPYSSRFFPREPRTQTLATLIRQEKVVEDIIRTRTWSTIRERCGDEGSQTWRDAVEKWQNKTRS